MLIIIFSIYEWPPKRPQDVNGELFEIRKFILQSRASYTLFQLGGSQDQQTQSPVHHVITQLYGLLCGYFPFRV